jgi:hypothetical protein
MVGMGDVDVTWCPRCEPNLEPREAARRPIEPCAAHSAYRLYRGAEDQRVFWLLAGSTETPTEAEVNRAFCNLLHRGQRA